MSYRDDKRGIERRTWHGRVVAMGSIHGSVRLNDFTFYNAAIPGDSGGACFNSRGELVGIIWGTGRGRTHTIHAWAIRQALKELN